MPLLPPATASHRPSWRLVLLTALVLLAHWALLRAAPLSLAAHASSDASAAWAFSTRTIAAESAARVVPPAQPANPSAKRPVATRPAAEPVHTTHDTPAPRPAEPYEPVTQVLEQNSAIAPVEPTPYAIETVANTSPNDGPFANNDMLLAAAAMPATKPSAAGPNTANPAAAAALPPAKAVRKFVFPPSTRLKYDVKGEKDGFPYNANSNLQWSQDGKTYNTRLELTLFFYRARVQTSTGRLGAHGLEPTRFGDKQGSEVAAHFDYDKNKVTFSANTPDVPLLPGAQDQLSVILQMASMLAADPKLFTQGSTLSFQAVGPKSAEAWVFTIGATEKLDLPGGRADALRLWREPNGQYDSRIEIWFAPEMNYLPLRIRLSQANGDMADLLWKSTQK
jgi:hypothetical protein